MAIVRSTAPRGCPFDLDWSLVAASREVLLGKHDLPKSATAPECDVNFNIT